MRDELRQALGAAPVPDGFARRVVADHARRRRRNLRWGAAALVGVAALAALIAWPRGGASVERGEARILAQLTVRLGERAVVVAEPGAELRWDVPSRGAAHVEQTAGAVFYRVDAGAPFSVATPLADVRALGTCFRVEVLMKPQNKLVVAAAAGAIVAAGVVVTVYEGRVRVRNAGGAVEAGPGERIVIGGPGAAPAASRPGMDVALAAGGAGADPSSAESAARRVTSLEAQVAQLEGKLATVEKQRDAALRRASDAKRGPDAPELVGLDAEDWRDMATRCEFRYAMPPLEREGLKLSPEAIDELGLTAEEAAAVTEAVDAATRQHLATLRALYIEATGDETHVDELNPSMLWVEILDKAGGTGAARRRVAEERAGLVPPPADPSTAPISERYFRFVLDSGDQLERDLAALVGPERARVLRVELAGNRGSMSGCDD